MKSVRIIDGQEPIEVVRVEELNGTPAAELAVRGWLENVEKGQSDGVLNMASNLQAFIGYAANGCDMLPAGVITWSVETSRVWVHQSYVLPEFRGRGVYSAMWMQLLEHVTADLPAIESIASAAHIRNQTMRAIAAKQGRTEEAVILKYAIQR